MSAIISCHNANFIHKTQLEVPASMNNSASAHMQGVYRQRSYDNLQNGKLRSPFHRNSIKSLHLPPSFANNHNQLTLNKRFSLSINTNGSSNNSNNLNLMNRGMLLTPQHHYYQAQAIPSNFKYVSPQSRYEMNGSHYDSNSLPRYPYHKNRAIHGVHHRLDGTCVEYYRHVPIRHPTTPPPAPPIKMSPQSNTEEQVLLPTPTSSTSSGDNCSNSEWDPMINGSKVRSGLDHMTHYRACKRQLQQASQFLHPNAQHQVHLDNYFQQFSHQSPYKKYLNAVSNHQLQLSPQNVVQQSVHQVYHDPSKRHSNVYEYHFSNFDLNSIHEDARNES
jgi:hypothetical protein